MTLVHKSNKNTVINETRVNMISKETIKCPYNIRIKKIVYIPSHQIVFGFLIDSKSKPDLFYYKKNV